MTKTSAERSAIDALFEPIEASTRAIEKEVERLASMSAEDIALRAVLARAALDPELRRSLRAMLDEFPDVPPGQVVN